MAETHGHTVHYYMMDDGAAATTACPMTRCRRVFLNILITYLGKVLPPLGQDTQTHTHMHTDRYNIAIRTAPSRSSKSRSRVMALGCSVLPRCGVLFHTHTQLTGGPESYRCEFTPKYFFLVGVLMYTCFRCTRQP